MTKWDYCLWAFLTAFILFLGWLAFRVWVGEPGVPELQIIDDPRAY